MTGLEVVVVLPACSGDFELQDRAILFVVNSCVESLLGSGIANYWDLIRLVFNHSIESLLLNSSFFASTLVPDNLIIIPFKEIFIDGFDPGPSILR